MLGKHSGKVIWVRIEAWVSVPGCINALCRVLVFSTLTWVAQWALRSEAVTLPSEPRGFPAASVRHEKGPHVHSCPGSQDFWGRLGEVMRFKALRWGGGPSGLARWTHRNQESWGCAADVGVTDCSSEGPGARGPRDAGSPGMRAAPPARNTRQQVLPGASRRNAPVLIILWRQNVEKIGFLLTLVNWIQSKVKMFCCSWWWGMVRRWNYSAWHNWRQPR